MEKFRIFYYSPKLKKQCVFNWEDTDKNNAEKNARKSMATAKIKYKNMVVLTEEEAKVS